MHKKPLPLLPAHSDEKRAGRFPSWLRYRLPRGEGWLQTNEILRKYRLHTVCEEAKCPNRFECYSRKTATFLALGKSCTRSCGFCDVDFSKSPPPPEEDEPERIALSVKELGLRHVVITMVARDDLEDKGAVQIAQIVRSIRTECPGTTIELLASDFSGERESWEIVLASCPDVFNHNIETVRRLSPKVRHKATYEGTLELLSYVRAHPRPLLVKSGLMVGLGEGVDEVKETIADLHRAGCHAITIGQYLQSNRKKLAVKSFVTPQQFEQYKLYGLSLGVKYLYSSPLVRSSYHATMLAPSP